MDEFIECLLCTWREKGKFGLSIPFIVGAIRLKGLLNGSASDSCDSVLKQLQLGDKMYRLAYCDKADDLILAPINRQPNSCKQIQHNGNPTSLWVQQDVLAEECYESVDLSSALWKQYGSNIGAERYSCTKGEYHQFTPEDLALIDEAFAKMA
jgi:hypothetical protein